MALCRLCSTEQPLIKAHVIPEAFFRVQRVDGEAPTVLLTNVAGQHPKNSPTGVYDKGILCRACEDKFQLLDDYGIEVLLTQFGRCFRPVEQDGRTAGFESCDVDQSRLLRFLVGVLWRASVSTRDFYKHVALGPYEASAAAVVNHPEHPIPQVFAAMLWRWRTTRENDAAADAMLDPIQETLQGVNAYRIYFGRMVAAIKVSGQPFPPLLRDLALESKPLLRIVTRDFSKSSDLAGMVSVVTTADSKR